MKNRFILTSLLAIFLATYSYANTQNSTHIHYYSASEIPKNMSVQEKKKRFYALLVPAVQKVYNQLTKEYLETKKLVQKNPHDPKILKLMKKYSAKDPKDLLMRMKPHPKSIALAQAAMESAWATSHFFRIANNIFGVWSFNPHEPRVAAGKKRGNKTIYVRKYATITDSVKDYYKTLATNKAFQKFREAKMKTDDPYTLVKYLDKYSERGTDYTKELASMIRHNKLTQYDK